MPRFLAGHIFTKTKNTVSYTHLDVYKRQGLESFWTYHSQSAGRAGTIHINDYTGNLILEHETFSLSGSRLPVGLSHVYNSSEAGGKDLGYGRGFRLDCHQTIARREIGDTVYLSLIHI